MGCHFTKQKGRSRGKEWVGQTKGETGVVGVMEGLRDDIRVGIILSGTKGGVGEKQGVEASWSWKAEGREA